ncbi:MAG: ADP-ribosylglycohydrolase family protein [Kiritimatiellia bacterium]|jgi:hypothetical protein|nr:ADP-ribosylglycohydrolase family protein [Kiritimatiellia bacterium]
MKKTLIAAMLIICLGTASTLSADLKTRNISMDEYVDKMKAGWIGQMAGVGWGAPTEFRFKGVIISTNKVPEWKPGKINQFKQDDIYVEMTFIQTLEDYGFDVSIRQAGIDFANSGYRLWHANTCGRKNLRNGIAPPDSGHPKFNKCADDIDYQIEADYSGLIAPGMPQIPIELGEKFGRVMNYGDGFYAGQFVGAMYSAAFFETDIIKIIEDALKSIPAESQYAEMVRDMLKWYEEDSDDWQATWDKIEKKYHMNPEYTHAKCSKPGDMGKFSIDAKLNGAYILMGMLYGKGDIDKTIVISMRCGQDSDCNPSNAGGILCTALGMSKLPEKFTSALDMKGKFSHTRYDFPGLVEVSKKLVRQAVVRCGGSVKKDKAGKEMLIIPVKKVVPSELIQTSNPGPIANSKFTEEEMAMIKGHQKKPVVVAQKKPEVVDWKKEKKMKEAAKAKEFLDGEMKKFAKITPGWTLTNCHKEMDAGFHASWSGRKNVLVTHPHKDTDGCVLSREVDIPEGKKTTLHFEAGHFTPHIHPRHKVNGDWMLIVRVNKQELVKKIVGVKTAKEGWMTVDVDLSEYAGKKVNIELVNQANDWWYEAGYWAGINLKHE